MWTSRYTGGTRRFAVMRANLDQSRRWWTGDERVRDGVDSELGWESKAGASRTVRHWAEPSHESEERLGNLGRDARATRNGSQRTISALRRLAAILAAGLLGFERPRTGFLAPLREMFRDHAIEFSEPGAILKKDA